MSDDWYVLDTTSFTELMWRYPRDMFEPVWEQVDRLVKAGRIFSSELVLEELSLQDDHLEEWIGKNRSIFVPLDNDTQQTARLILETHAKLIDTKKTTSFADPFLIALASNNSWVLVSEERARGQQVKIPSVCRHYGVRCVTLLDMLKKEGFRSPG